MARVITDLEMKNTELETKECYCLLDGITPIELCDPLITSGFPKFDCRGCAEYSECRSSNCLISHKGNKILTITVTKD